ncbi:TspO/MBR family protein [Propylenella binzhouense]|uniref:Tryptophan-rich sensory protein n=1 Tax=Propylenella binzhouense TaxID=2555902 RepID=A0A964T255_9HYPH|nr:TspO/MBR family protein [Propylenella binzhouense]MYZ46870.1 tryptophan-rich sensory protein [Propylenella binzhouense]
MKLWWTQLALNFAWSSTFFSGHHIDAALGIIVLLLITIIGFIAVAWRQDKVASLLFVPYASWVAFASVLNGAIWPSN